jgi:hypothetical protein
MGGTFCTHGGGYKFIQNIGPKTRRRRLRFEDNIEMGH